MQAHFGLLVAEKCTNNLCNAMVFNIHRCLSIGFDQITLDKCYEFSNQIQTFRHLRGQTMDKMDDKFIRNLQYAQLKFPFPHMVSVTLKSKTNRPSTHHLISQGKFDSLINSEYQFSSILGNPNFLFWPFNFCFINYLAFLLSTLF